MESIERGIRRSKPSGQFPKGGYQARVNFGGHREEKIFERLGDARRWREQRLTQLRSEDSFPGDSKRGRELFKDVAEDWRKSIARRKPKTVQGYESILRRQILPTFGSKSIGSIRPRDVQAFMDKLHKNGAAPGTVRNVYRTLSPIFKYAVKHDRLNKTPCVGIELPSLNREQMVFLTLQEVQSLAQEVDEHYSFLITFACWSGLRAGELCGLRVRNFDQVNRRVYVEESVSDISGTLHVVRPKTKASRRSVDLPEPLVKELAQRIEGKGPNDHIFTGERGGILRWNNFMGRQFKPAVKRLVASDRLPREKAGLRGHDMRHTYAAILIEQGAHPLAIKEQLGHESITTTLDLYGHMMPSLIESLMQAVGEAYVQNGNGNVVRIKE